MILQKNHAMGKPVKMIEGNIATDYESSTNPKPIPYAEALTQAPRAEEQKQDALTNIVSAILESVLDISKYVGKGVVKTALNLFNVFAG